MSTLLPKLVVASLLVTCGCSNETHHDAGARAAGEKTFGGRSRSSPGGSSGVGWSIAPSTQTAVREALRPAEAGIEGPVDLTFVSYTPQHHPAQILAALHGADPRRRVIGMTSHDGLLTADGYHSSPDGVVGVLVLKVPGMTTGIGGAGFDEVPPGREGEAARLAYRRAVAEAGRTLADKPSMVLIVPTLRSEEKALAAITEEVGLDVPVIGGTAAGPSKDIGKYMLTPGLEWSIVVGDRVITAGAAVAVFYTPAPFGWAYGGGFERSTTKSGVITDAAPRLIRTIDGRPAVDVYDEWLGGGLKEAMARGDNMLVWCALHPLSRNVSGNGVTQTQFVHPHPHPDQSTYPGALHVGANVAVGETLNLGEGSWNILLNRFAQLPRQAKNDAAGIDAVAGLFFYCGGALETIPRENRPNMGYLVSESMGRELPWLGVFSWGEQGHVTGIGNLHGNEMASTLLFPAQRR